MSQRNGDRARADQKRKAKLHQRTRIWEFRKVRSNMVQNQSIHTIISIVDKSGPETVPVLKENND